MIDDMEHVYITAEKKYKKFKVKITQEYLPEFDMGHYKVVIEDLKGNIVYIVTTCCGAPKGKIDRNDCDKYYKEFERDYLKNRR